MPGGKVVLSVPPHGATLHQAEDFLVSKLNWVRRTRAKVLARPPVAALPPVTEAELANLRTLLAELNAKWSALVGEPDVAWKIRAVKTVWGCCHWRDRYITYNAELARKPRELVEYVVVHEFTHFAVHNHGPDFQRLMDQRLPGWKALRKRLNARETREPVAPEPQPETPHEYTQAEFTF